MANTTWSTTDKTALITLSGGNLIATSGGSSQGVRGIDGKNAGKYYVEYTGSTWATGNTVAGFGNRNASLSSAGTGTVYYNRSGQLSVNGSLILTGLTALTAGAVVCAALDIDNKLIWFRVGAAGNWNGNASYNPATGVGGVSIAVLLPPTSLLPLYPYTSNWSDTITANFGDSAFVGSVPSGFTAGFPTGTPPLNAIATQVAVEQWASPNPAAQLTQVAAEVWAAVAAGVSSALVTQIALEEWAVIPVLVPPATPSRQVGVSVNVG